MAYQLVTDINYSDVVDWKEDFVPDGATYEDIINEEISLDDTVVALDFASACCDWIIGNLGLNYDWPGNVRQLRTAVEHGIVMCSSNEVQPEDLPEYLHAMEGRPIPQPTKRGSTDFELDLFVFCFFLTAVSSALYVIIKGSSGNIQSLTEFVDRVLWMILMNILQDK